MVAEAKKKAAGGQVLSSYMAGTNGGGSGENVPGFDVFRAITAGFDTRRVAGPTFLAARPDGGFFSQGSSAANVQAVGSPASKPEAVIGVDGRVMVPDTSLVPWRCICQLEVEYESGPVGFGTGFFVSTSAVITAAHVLVDRSSYGWENPRMARRVRVLPGRNGSLAPYGYFVADQDLFEIPRAWRNKTSDRGEAASEDIAAIRVPPDLEVGDAPFGERIGFFGLKAFGEDEAAEAAMLFINNAGYPYEAGKPYGSLWYNAGRVRSFGDTFVEYMVDTEGGQSGSPIYFYDAEADQRYVIAIHTTGDFVNRGLRVTDKLFARISGWAGRDPA